MRYVTQAMMAASIFAFATQTFAVPPANVAIDPTEKAKIESVVHDYLLKNPEILVEAMQVLQRKEYEETEKTVKQTQKIASSFAKPLFHQPNDPINGNPTGKVTLVEFFDYQCPHCVEMVPIIGAIIKANPNLRVVYKEFPIRGALSEFAARAALAANKQGKYAAFSHALLKSNTPLTQDSILQVAKGAGLDMDKLKKEMNDASIKSQLDANMKLAKDLKLIGTPAIFIGKTQSQGKEPINYIPGLTDEKQLQAVLKNFN